MELTAQTIIPVGGQQTLELVWKGDDLPTGVTIASATKTVTPATGLTVGNPVLNTAQDGVTFSALAVTAGSYSILIVATRSDTMKNVGLYHVTVSAVTDLTSAASNALITVEQLSTYMGTQVSKNLADLTINGVSQEFESEVDCDLFNATYTASPLDGSGKFFMYLPHWPVTDVDSVVEDGVTLTEGTDFFVDYDYGILTKPAGGKWTTARGGVVVTYDAGYAAVPGDIVLACLKQCAVEYMRSKKSEWGQTSRSAGDGSVSLVEPGLLKDVQAVLARYQRVRI